MKSGRFGFLIFGILLAGLVACSSIGGAACPAVDPSVISTGDSPRRVIVDVDMAQEDMNALLFLLQHPRIEVMAVTISGTGEAHCGPGVEHALTLLDLHGAAADVPVACGPESPLGLDHEFPAAWRTDVDNLYGLSLPESSRQPSDQTAPELMQTVIMEAQEPIAIIATGPLTNLAAALMAESTLPERIDSVTIMGGAVDVPGNVGVSGAGIDNERAEWNFYVDPTAARVVLESGVPITLVPLDATADVPVTTDFVRCLGEQASTPEVSFVFDLLSANSDFVESGGFQFWDSLTAAILVDEAIGSYQSRTLTVIDEEGPDSGAVVEAADGALVRVAMSADRKRFEELFISVLNR